MFLNIQLIIVKNSVLSLIDLILSVNNLLLNPQKSKKLSMPENFLTILTRIHTQRIFFKILKVIFSLFMSVENLHCI